MTRLPGKVALVSGGARGIGASVAKLLAEEGASVVLGDLLDEEGEAVAEEIGERGKFVHLDVTSRSSWAATVSAAEEAFGPIGILVNNAGVAGEKRLEDITEREYHDVLAVNQHGVFLGMQAALPSLRRAGGGSIVNISSVFGMGGASGHFPYVASKWAVRGMTKAAALELGPYGIRVNSIHPGFIRTPMVGGDLLPDDMFGEIALQRADSEDRAGQPVHIAGVVLFLASDDSAFVTGEEHVVDGGVTVPIGPLGATAERSPGGMTTSTKEERYE